MNINRSIREHLENIEKETLSVFAKLSSESKGRAKADKQCQIRPIFQHDRDRIVHCKAFRRLEDKTQVFLSPQGSHYRNRLTHTLEVSQIARTIAKSLLLNESLTEAIAMGHDIGHTPFGHAGERALGKLIKGGFRHEKQSLRVVDLIANSGEGLNLSWEVRNGIILHSKGKDALTKSSGIPATLEGQIVRLADIIAYVNHDIDDAVSGGFLDTKTVPYRKEAGRTASERINNMVKDIIKTSFEAMSAGTPVIRFSEQMNLMVESIRDFLFRNVYESDEIKNEFDKAELVIVSLFNYFKQNYDSLARLYSPLISKDPERNVADFIASITDSYAIHLYKQLFLPEKLSYPEFRYEE